MSEGYVREIRSRGFRILGRSESGSPSGFSQALRGNLITSPLRGNLITSAAGFRGSSGFLRQPLPRAPGNRSGKLLPEPDLFLRDASAGYPGRRAEIT